MRAALYLRVSTEEQNPESQAADVRRLAEAASARDVDEMPSGEDIAEELERFLRDQRHDD